MNLLLFSFVITSFVFRLAYLIFIEHYRGVDIIFNNDWRLLSADVYLSKNLYFFVVQDGSRSLLKNINVTRIKNGEMQDVLEYPVQSAESVAVDWVNGNLYWADKKNQFIEVVDLNIQLEFPISRHRRRILFSRRMADIYSLVVDPWEQYLFWLHIGAFMVIERARLDGSERRIIHQSNLFKSSRLAIDRHRKMLFWWGMEGSIHRIDYQGQTGCSMKLQKDWKNWNPTFLTFTDAKLIFINDDLLWETSFTCGSGVSSILSVNLSAAPVALITTKYQLTVSGNRAKTYCTRKVCSSICLPTEYPQYRCVCMTGTISPNNNSSCPSFPSKSLIIGSSPKIYQMSLEENNQPLEILSEQSGLPFRFAFDSVMFSLLYVDFNSSSIYSLDLNKYGTPQKLFSDIPVLSQIPVSIGIDPLSRNIYWINHQNSEVWVARISPFNQLKYATLLLSWLPNKLFRDLKQQNNQLPGELVIDSLNRYIFVTMSKDESNSIERYWLDGTHKFSVVTPSSNFLPRGLATDDKGKRLFFINMLNDKYEMISVDYDGNHLKVIDTKFQEISGLTYFDGYIYWTELESLSIHRIKPDGSSRSLIMKTRNLEARTMPIIAISRDVSIDTNAPCREGSNKCEQLCFPTKLSHHSYTCGCSDPASVLLNFSHCSYTSEMLVFHNTSLVVTYQLSPSSNQQMIILDTNETDVRIFAIQLDHFRNHIYWINEATNCVMKTTVSSDVRRPWRIFCLSSDIISNIGLDIARNNLYVSISGSVWSRIKLIRLPFSYSDISWKKTVYSSQYKNRAIGAIAIHSILKLMFWFESRTKNQMGIVELYQAYLDGSNPMSIWEGLADSTELVIDDQENYICWKNNVHGKLYRYNIDFKKLEIYHLSPDLLSQVLMYRQHILHVYPVRNSFYILLNGSVYQINLTYSDSVISMDRLKLILRIADVPSIRSFLLVSKKSTSTKQLALLKTDINPGSVIMCPTTVNGGFVPCSQFCLPVPQKECGCASTYSLNADTSTCTDNSDLLMAMTDKGEVIGMRISLGEAKDEESQPIEWVEVADQKLKPDQKFIDAVHWSSRNVILRLDNFGYLSAVDQMQPFVRIKEYKQLSMIDEEGHSKKYPNSYEKIYKHVLKKGIAFQNYDERSRFSLAIDPISDTLLWSDWVNGIIATERLNVDRDKIDFLGVILDFRQSNRRPLQIAIAPISSSLIWISADLVPSGSNDSSIWRQFWIEMSDLDGSRRSVLVKEPGIPSCLTVDVHSGQVYWIDTRTNKLMYLHIHWDNFQIKVGHVLGYNMRITVNSLLSVGVSSSTSVMVILKKNLFWMDDFQQLVASTSLSSDSLKYINDVGISEKSHIYDFKYLKSKLKGVIRLMARISPQDFRLSSLGTLLQNHPCSRVTHTVQNQPCSHFCLSTLPISLTEEYSFLMTAQQLAGKYRCSCPLSMSISHKVSHKVGVCIKSRFIKCNRYQIPCRAGLVFSKSEGISKKHCLSTQQRCDSVEDCLDGSDEFGCNACNSTHPYSCSGSGLCLTLTKRCDGVVDCESDEQCCGNQKFECLSGSRATRCFTKTDRCNGVIDCFDGSDERKCASNEKVTSSNDDHFTIGNLSNNHTVAIIAGSIAISACSIAIIYICLSRRNRHKTIHESCLFRANNVNIMVMPPTQRPSRPYRYSTPYQRPESHENISHAKSCDIIDNLKHCDDSDPTSQSFTSLSDCYRRIKNPQPCPCSVLGRPLFSMQDDVFFHLSQIKRRNHCASNGSIEKINKPPPSEVTLNTEDIDESEDHIDDNRVTVSRNSLASSPCDSELEEIYVHRYQLMRRPPLLDNYPSCLLQNLLSACNQTSQLCNTPTSVSRDLVVENIYRRRRKKLFKYRNKRNSSKVNLSLSPPRRSRLRYSQNESDLYQHLTSNLHISPPPPSPITVVST